MTMKTRYRICPPRVEALLPPHPIEFRPNDTDFGRGCLRCGFSVPSGYRHIHAEWCERRAAQEHDDDE